MIALIVCVVIALVLITVAPRLALGIVAVGVLLFALTMAGDPGPPPPPLTGLPPAIWYYTWHPETQTWSSTAKTDVCDATHLCLTGSYTP